MSKIIYDNPLSCEKDLEGFILEGQAKLSFENGCLCMENELPDDMGQTEDFVLWCPKGFPSDIAIEWEFRPVKEPGLATLFFAAKEINENINAYQLSYFRRKEADERAFHTCNLSKSSGSNPVAQGADPIPDASEDSPWYRMCVIKKSGHIKFGINDLEILEYRDDGITCGDILTGGHIGFRQLAPMVAEYRNLRVTWI